MIKTRTVQRSDGRIEIHRVLTFDGLAESKIDDPITFERMIVWLEDARDWPFVRELIIDTATSRRGPLHLTGLGRVVGFSKLTPDAPANDGKYVRRVFYLKNGDVVDAPLDRIPRNAVDPRTVLPGTRSQPIRLDEASTQGQVN